MKIVGRIVVSMSFVGCGSPSKGSSLRVGMPSRDAVSVLESAGATQVQIDMIDETTSEMSMIDETLPERIAAYELPDGRVLVLETAKATGCVSDLQLFANADQPKETQVSTRVSALELGNN